MITTIIKNRGIGESRTSNLCSLVTQAVPADKVRIIETNWLAQYGPVPRLDGVAYDRARKAGVHETIDLVNLAPGPVVLLGFSGGAHVAGDAADLIGSGRYGAAMYRKIAGVGLFADPANPGLTPSPFSWGIAGSRRIRGSFPVWRANDPRDVIPLCPGNSPLRTFADHTESMSLIDPAAWAGSIWLKLRASQFQQVAINWRDPASVRAQYEKAISDFNGYRNGDHTSYHKRSEGTTGRTYVQNMVDRVRGVLK